jgi:pimeloyl-ACP methyl ester carboxylesterase
MEAGVMETMTVGDLMVHVWRGTEPDAPVVIAAHGITANGLSWARVAEGLDGRVTLIAPDLRGRGGSREAPGPYGIVRHADDLAAVLDDLGVPEAVFAGHSMGGFVAAVAAVRHPWRATRAVLVDGGLGFQVPADADVDAVLTAVIGPAMKRLTMEFPTRDDYRAYWQAHPAFAGQWGPWVDDYIQHDLVGTGPYRSSCVLDAVRADGADQIRDPETLGAIHALRVPAVFLHAERGFTDDPNPLYPQSALAGLPIPEILVPDTNHYSILIGDKGAATVADYLTRAAGVGR